MRRLLAVLCLLLSAQVFAFTCLPQPLGGTKALELPSNGYGRAWGWSCAINQQDGGVVWMQESFAVMHSIGIRFDLMAAPVMASVFASPTPLSAANAMHDKMRIAPAAAEKDAFTQLHAQAKALALSNAPAPIPGSVMAAIALLPKR